ncbi:hypothetical protein AU197_14445 [Mycobacterium sp. IS-1590]|nr:hypothetical protein AU197_14445 [Mycobacterium sp. IS-1590]
MDVDEDFFSVAMTPFGGGLEVIADFTRDRLSDEEDLQRGDVVYVTVRTIRDETGPHDTSTIRLRRLGTWTADEVAEQTRRAKDELIEMARYID